jgi:DNA-binding FadR family transcriptional regulator
MSDLKPARNKGQEICAELGSAIIRGVYDTREQLPTETQLSERLGVSRGAVREAIKVLAAKGLVTSRPRQGTRVTNISEWNLLDKEILEWMQRVEYSHKLLFDLAQLRYAIEPEAAAIVAARREMVNFSEMAVALREMEREGLSVAELLALDNTFHLGILEATDNRFFIQLKPMIGTTLAFGMELIGLYDLFGADRQINNEDHQLLFDAMLDGKADKARELSQIMISKIIDTASSAIAESDKQVN